MKRIFCLRASAQEQQPDRQIEGSGYFGDGSHIGYVSALNEKRPIRGRVGAALRAGDRLFVWDLDRALCSVADAVLEAEQMRLNHGINPFRKPKS